jgi:hypothetical protein
MPAVVAMANPPQNVTRIAPIITPAPPARAAIPPRSASNANEEIETRGINPCAGAIAVTSRGINAPIAKLASVYHPYSMPYEHFDVFYCRGLHQPLKEIWPQVKNWD